MTDRSYSIREEADRIFRDVLLKDTRLHLPSKVHSAASNTSFLQSTIDTPYIPVPLKFTETSSALWALAATIGSAIAKDRYNTEQKATVNTDIASLFLFSAACARVNGKTIGDPAVAARYTKYDLGRMHDPWRRFCTNIYPTRDGKWFHLHGSMNSDRSLTMVDLPKENPGLASTEDIVKKYCDTARQFDSDWLDAEANEHYRQAGTVCLTREEFLATEHGKATVDHPIYFLERRDVDVLPPVPYPSVTGKQRPLEGLKMLDLSRAIAAPTIAKLAALFGATVIRVSNDQLPDMGPLLVDGNLGKRDVTLNLKTDEGRAALKRLIEGADIVLDGYRPGTLDRLGFGADYVHALGRRRGKGIVFVRENCYGWEGPWAKRSGWQQISDCVTGVSWIMGRFLGLDEPVIPLLPNSDYQTGLVGFIGLLAAVDKRATEGGNHLVSVSLNQYNNFLLSLGEHTPEVKKHLLDLHPGFKPRHYDDMTNMFGLAVSTLQTNVPRLFRPSYFGNISSRFGGDRNDTLTYVLGAASYDASKLGYDIGSCFLGQYEPEWPEGEVGKAAEGITSRM
ncbi:CAIB/BAIF family enzyme [Pyricularia oryzae 70-15]|uniref:CAIB/BAIF family enzyme n=3 Tax=Pyricularia oryzae TaxID=318829 RepID=G4NFJ7_PYRO7|nr:CAIB/BAIF family enzyme [Pyricularia oryzae 70-15]EHA46804.1 CAIB/BAIF family enzyme [Pyricularia oryzae 70-15]KAI7914588.1 CAIB/BAIF family enzyme [Pyricularia oryzae]KAI7914917.1 CAIB/BAIF family enzyme [Pyricularia oryzae]